MYVFASIFVRMDLKADQMDFKAEHTHLNTDRTVIESIVPK